MNSITLPRNSNWKLIFRGVPISNNTLSWHFDRVDVYYPTDQEVIKDGNTYTFIGLSDVGEYVIEHTVS